MSVMQKTVFIIGPGRSFGKELIKLFRGAGYKIGVISSGATYEADISKVADITNNFEYKTALKSMCEELGHISCLIYNPKISPKGTGLEIDTEVFQKSLEVNAVGAITAVQEAAAFLKNGKVIFTNGGFKDEPDPKRFALSVGKATLFGVHKALESPLKEKNISIHTITIGVPVENNGPLTPEAVVKTFLSVAEGSVKDRETLLEG
jgi:NAD(P)-dependent dehydrogenase (short-subunit alcohol dehydrogenase family)